MHMLRNKDLFPAELETVRVSRHPTTVIVANGSIESNEEATVYVRDVDLFVKLQLLQETPPVLSLGKLCKDHRYSDEWVERSTTESGIKTCNTDNSVPTVVPRLSSEASSFSSARPPQDIARENLQQKKIQYKEIQYRN